MIKRLLQSVIQDKLGRGKAIILLGARQTGKTTLLRSIMKEKREEALFLNCDDPSVRTALEAASTMKLKQILGPNKLIFIDEAQRVKNIGLTLKLIIDNIPDKQIIVSGSSALEIANEVNEPLTGRKYEYQLYPISWEELANHAGYIDAVGQLEIRLIFGMYPDITVNTGGEKELLNNLAGSYLYKDMLSYGNIRKPELLDKLLTALAFQIGQQVSYRELADLLQIDKETVASYIRLLEQTFVLFRLGPLSRNLRNELKRTRKIYFYDNGIRNTLISNFNDIQLRNDVGPLWENFLISERTKFLHYHRIYCNQYFWRTQQQQEIDYIEERNGVLYAYEFKWNPRKNKVRFPKTFLKNYPEAATQVISSENFMEFLTKL